MMSDFVTAVAVLMSEPILLIALRGLILAAVVKMTLGFARNRTHLVLAFLLWLAVFVLILVLSDAAQATRMMVRYDALVACGALIGVGYVAYERLLGRF